ncbi:hypothetical protein EJ05DRAFT_45240 [Pseudovirgaria hyperparasitica]|uniref:Uncharacterized protein n=1 Tax=Pseudovirgaria hyperparasitica TaxID=470096 RepID=A0A6A6W1P4_9PEZI|nr:uncharacterized protein EJ05DRAFT_45240 [Pseudovirgaria hyperparasitica]KAF2756838.1 hypothetical protein EJ05DRAFT_45240 [Pseudovirgaria hyperparasitica]
MFAMRVTTSMRVSPITFLTYRAVFIQTGPMLYDIPHLVRDFSIKRLQSMLVMIFIVMTMVSLLACPRFGSSMTGCSGVVRLFIRTEKGDRFIIHDGSSINRADEFVVTWPKSTGWCLWSYVHCRQKTSNVFSGASSSSGTLSVELFFLLLHVHDVS